MAIDRVDNIPTSAREQNIQYDSTRLGIARKNRIHGMRLLLLIIGSTITLITDTSSWKPPLKVCERKTSSGIHTDRETGRETNRETERQTPAHHCIPFGVEHLRTTGLQLSNHSTSFLRSAPHIVGY